MLCPIFLEMHTAHAWNVLSRGDGLFKTAFVTEPNCPAHSSQPNCPAHSSHTNNISMTQLDEYLLTKNGVIQ
uniref:Uncharacterized protein n=1 Tax=Arundo donax TaxID=35708 RepID=A0A0A9C6X8_ARUDO